MSNNQPTYRSIEELSPNDIYGFKSSLDKARNSKGKTKRFVLEDHPDFPNPRSEYNESSQRIMEDIRDSKNLLEPIKVWEDEEGNNVLIDGKTRLTAIGQHRLENPKDTTNFSKIPVIFVELSKEDAQLQMGRLNYDRENLSKLQYAKHLKGIMEAQGLKSTDQLCKMMGITNRARKREVKELFEVLNAPVAESVEAGDVSITTAKQIVKNTPAEEQKTKASAVKKKRDEKVGELKKSGKSVNESKVEREAAQEVGVTRQNVSKKNKVILEKLLEVHDQFVTACIVTLELNDQFDEDRAFTTAEVVEYGDHYSVIGRWQTLCELSDMGLEDMNLRDQLQAVRDSVPEGEISNYKTWLPSDEQVDRTKEDILAQLSQDLTAKA